MERIDRISCRDFIEINGYAYFSNWFYNGLFQVNIQTGETIFLGMFPDELFTQLDIHHNVHRKGELLYFFPRRGRHMHIYNIQQNSMRSIEIRSKEEPFYIIEKVWVEKDGFVFIPMNRELYVKKYDFITKEVKRFERRGAFYDKDEKTKNDFPDKVLLKQKFHKDAEKFLWHYCQEEKCWNSFTPRGCELLFYREEKKEIEKIPLKIKKEDEYKEYLSKVRQEFLHTSKVLEGEAMKLSEFLEQIAGNDILAMKDKENCFGSGERIWECLL